MPDTAPDPAAAAVAIATLKPLPGDRLVMPQAVREHHSKDMSYPCRIASPMGHDHRG
jgi:hypothetical protein